MRTVPCAKHGGKRWARVFHFGTENFVIVPTISLSKFLVSNAMVSLTALA